MSTVINHVIRGHLKEEGPKTMEQLREQFPNVYPDTLKSMVFRMRNAGLLAHSAGRFTFAEVPDGTTSAPLLNGTMYLYSRNVRTATMVTNTLNYTALFCPHYADFTPEAIAETLKDMERCQAVLVDEMGRKTQLGQLIIQWAKIKNIQIF
jgi:hypothetical protein